MINGIQVDLHELIALKQWVRKAKCKTNGLKRTVGLGNYRSKARGRGMDFAEVRHYQNGDEIRHMDWRVTARTGRPHVKLYHEERDRPVILFTDFSPSMFFGTKLAFKSVIAARLSALVAWSAVQQDDKVGGLLCSLNQHQELVPKARNNGVLPLLNALKTYSELLDRHKENNSASFITGLKRLARVSKPGSLIVLISDFYQLNQEAIRELQHIAQHTNLMAYQICDPLELAPPPRGHYAVASYNDQLLLDLQDKSTFNAYRTWCMDHQNQVSAAFKTLNIRPIQVVTTADLIQLVHQSFPRRRHD